MDFNSDGRKDIIVGERAGKVYYFSRNEDGTLHNEGTFPGIIVNYSSSPAVCDWNEDGKMDFLLGSQGIFPDKGVIYIWINSGTSESPKMTGGHALLDDTNNWMYHFRAMPQVFDLDNDGMKEVIVGEADGKIYFHENIGSKTLPKIKQGIPIPGLQVDYDSKFSICDWNEDGVWDFVVGSDAKDLYLFLGDGPVSNNKEHFESFAERNLLFTVKKNTLNIKTLESEEKIEYIHIHNSSGKVVSTVNNRNHSSEISIKKPQASGVYFLGIKTENQFFSKTFSLY